MRKAACCEANGTSIVQSPSTFLKHARPSLLPSDLYVPVDRTIAMMGSNEVISKLQSKRGFCVGAWDHASVWVVGGGWGLGAGGTENTNH